MHLKANTENLRQDSKTMASYNSGSNNDDDNGSRTSNTTNSNNNNNGDDNTSANNVPLTDVAEIKLKKQTLEQRKHELEKLLSEKSWLLQQIQKQETQILNGNYEYLNLNDILANLAQQYKQEQGGGGSIGSSGSVPSILRRKTTMAPSSSSASKENQNVNNNNSNRQSEVSNRSSEYDNYPGSGGGGSAVGVEQSSTSVAQMGVGVPMATQPLPTKNALKKRTTPTPTPTANINYIQLQRQQHQQLLQQQVEQQILQQQVEQQMFEQHLQYAVHQQQQHQQQQQQKLLHYQQQQRQFLQQQPADAISLYSVNSANVATLRHQHVAPQQQPIVVQCDKYYLSPTHQSYTDGGFIKSSQNIKKYISPMASPTLLPSSYELQQQQHLLSPLQQLQQHQRQLDAISLAPSYLSVDAETAHNLRWRSQSNIPQHTSPSHSQDMKSHSSDMLAHLPYNYYTTAHPPVPNLKSKPLDEISISSLNSETHKQKSKPKQWLESSLDGPAVIRSPQTELPPTLDVSSSSSSHAVATFSRVQPPHKQQIHSSARERAKLSSQSMSSGRHYSMSSAAAAQRHQHPQASTSGGSSKLLDDDGRYVKLSQSTSYLNSMEPIAITPVYHLDNASIDMPAFRLLPPKPNSALSQRVQATPPPRPPPVAEKLPPAPPVVAAATSSSSLSPDIRIESPKNMTIVQQATFQPYKEVTKPFEMSDFYKYSTKFRQKESSAGNDGGADQSAN